MNDTVELLDLVDENDNLIETLLRDEIYSKGLNYVRVVELFIKNDTGELWIPIRAAHKRIAPGGFDIGAGGHVEHGETYDEALKKEVSEELYWDLKDFPVTRIGKFGPKDGLNTISMVYEIKTNTAPVLNPEDFVSSKWISPSKLAEEIINGHPAKSNLLPLLRLVYNV